MNPIIWAIIIMGGVGLGTGLTGWFRKEGYVRQPTGKYGWQLTKADFKINHPISIIVIGIILAVVFYLVYLWAVQSA